LLISNTSVNLDKALVPNPGASLLELSANIGGKQ
jgi:hypothetical protein